MQPVLSQALRILIGHEDVDEEALVRAADEIRADPTIMQAFPEDEPIPVSPGPVLVSVSDTEALLTALDGTGVQVTAEKNALHRIGDGPIRFVTNSAAMNVSKEGVFVDGLDQRQYAIWQQLQQPGERLPLLLVSAELGAFRVTCCAWLNAEGMRDVISFAHLQTLLDNWDGKEVPKGDWQAARSKMSIAVQSIVADRAERFATAMGSKAKAQHKAASHRLIEELGRLLICIEPDTDDLNGKFHRLASEQTPTAHRLQNVFQRLGGYPNWEAQHVADLRGFRDDLAPSQIKTRLTGRELDAALADPRWVQ